MSTRVERLARLGFAETLENKEKKSKCKCSIYDYGYFMNVNQSLLSPSLKLKLKLKKGGKIVFTVFTFMDVFSALEELEQRLLSLLR
jgi:hypothetical protein